MTWGCNYQVVGPDLQTVVDCGERASCFRRVQFAGLRAYCWDHWRQISREPNLVIVALTEEEFVIAKVMES